MTTRERTDRRGVPRAAAPAQRPAPRPAPASTSRTQAVTRQRGTPPRQVAGRGGPVRTGPAHPHRRQRLLLAVVLLVLGVFVGRLVQVQGLDPAGLADTAFSQRETDVPIPAERGEILDANGVVLATSVQRYTLIANQVLLADWNDGVDAAAEAAAVLGPLIGQDPAVLGARLVGEDPYVVLARDLAPDVYRQVMEREIPGISGEATTQRVYPAGTTAGNIVGFLGYAGDEAQEKSGVAGIEQVYDEALSGVDGVETYERGANGQRIPTGEDEMVPAVPGRDVQLTVDRDLQYVTQDVIDRAVRTHGAVWGTVEVVDVTTGEILALADSGTTDPNDPDDADPSRAAAVVYEPGSTAKVIAMAAILENGLATPTTPFQVPYTYTVPNGETFRDSHEHPTLQLTLAGILAESSNTGTVMVGQSLPRQVRHDYLSKFGLGQLTGVGLPGETAGLLHDAEAWDGRSEYAVLFGQAVSVTTLQASQVFATIANGGVRVQPHIVAAVADETGAMVPTRTAEPTRVVSEETADVLLRMLEGAVVEGTGGNAAVPGYRIAGKTGTAQAFEGNGVVNTVASFVGIAPADDPRLVVNVTLYDPKTSIYGGDVAAPVFSEVTGYALQYLGVAPSGTTAELYPTTWQ